MCLINLNLCIFTYMDHSLYVCIKFCVFTKYHEKCHIYLYQSHSIVAFLSCLKWNYFLLESQQKNSSLILNLVKTFYMITDIMGNKKYFTFFQIYLKIFCLHRVIEYTIYKMVD